MSRIIQIASAAKWYDLVALDDRGVPGVQPRAPTPFFGARRAIEIKSADVTAYRVKRQSGDAANATINRELSALKWMFSLAVKGERLQPVPYIEMLKESTKDPYTLSSTGAAAPRLVPAR